MALKAQRGLNRRLELWRDCAERAFLVGGDTAVGWRSGRLGRVDSSHRRPAGI